MRRLVLMLAGIAGLMGVLPAASSAVIPGPNGPLVFTSGRDDGSTALTDGKAQIWWLSGPGGSTVRLSTAANLHHRHATWSPDRTKIAFARGAENAFVGPWDIFVQDLVSGGPPVNITNTPALGEDRPSWSPDGTRIAYTKEQVATDWQVRTKAATGVGGETLVAASVSGGAGASAQFAKPQWSPDSQTIFYGRIIAPADYDIYRSPADGSNILGTGVVTGPTNDYQPGLSANGTRLCFTRQGAQGKDIYTVPSTGGTAAPLLTTNGQDEYECTWSPDGTKVAFVRGAFGAGQLMMRNSDASGGIDTVTDVAGRFDGNPEWTRDPTPTCSNVSATASFNGFVSIPLTCDDERDPPFFQDPDVAVSIATGPANGALSALNDGSVIYTPNANFSGTDSFAYTGADNVSTSAPATVSITVDGPPDPGPGARPVVSGLEVKKRIRKGKALPKRTGTRQGAEIAFDLNVDATAILTFERVLAGRRVGGRCVKPTRANRDAKKCIRRHRRVKPNVALDGRQGPNGVAFKGRLSRRSALRPGPHRVTVIARGDAGSRSDPKRAKFRLVRSKKRR